LVVWLSKRRTTNDEASSNENLFLIQE